MQQRFGAKSGENVAERCQDFIEMCVERNQTRGSASQEELQAELRLAKLQGWVWGKAGEWATAAGKKGCCTFFN